MKLYYLFLSFILGPLNEFNTAFQADGTKIGFLAGKMQRLLRKFLMKFTLAKVLRQFEDITKVSYKDHGNQDSDDFISTGTATRTYLEDVKDEIDPHVKDKSFSAVRKFYTAVIDKCLLKFPFHDPVLHHLGFLDPEIRDSIDAVVQIAKRFPGLVDTEEMDQIAEEYREFQMAPDVTLPKYEKDVTRVDEFWGKLSLVSSKITGQKLYPLFIKVALAMVTIPNSSADCERTFSMVKKIQSDLRSDMDNDTLCALLSCKINQNCVCYTFCPTSNILSLAKSASAQYNREHQQATDVTSCT